NSCVWAVAPFSSFDQSILPLTVSTQTSIRLLPSVEADCKNTLPLETIGDELPLPGIGVFHRTLFVATNATGTFLSSALPRPCGPRKRVQSAAERVDARPTTARRESWRVCMAGMRFAV